MDSPFTVNIVNNDFVGGNVEKEANSIKDDSEDSFLNAVIGHKELYVCQDEYMEQEQNLWKKKVEGLENELLKKVGRIGEFGE
jgi:hypothetical protein